MRSYFPDVNVWLALAARGHESHAASAEWLSGISEGSLYFCRLTQLGLLRLLTQPAVMRHEVQTQIGAWKTYDRLLADERIAFHPEPESMNDEVRRLTSKPQHSSNDWPDAYLTAFARGANLKLVTFDRGLSKLAGPDTILLSAKQ
jgi:uncharacterized protein